MHKFVSSITDKEQRKKFAQIYNSLHASVNKNRQPGSPRATTIFYSSISFRATEKKKIVIRKGHL